MALLLEVRFSSDLKGFCEGLEGGERTSLLKWGLSGGEELRDVSNTFPVLPPAAFLLTFGLIPSATMYSISYLLISHITVP